MFLSVDVPEASKSRGRRLMPAISITPGREYKIGSVRRAPFGVFACQKFGAAVPTFRLVSSCFHSASVDQRFVYAISVLLFFASDRVAGRYPCMD
jgi:hypothetical protein